MSKHSKRTLRTTVALLAAGALAAGTASVANAQAPDSHPAKTKPTVVLVHGSWADNASFGTVGPRLRRDGYTVLNFDDQMRSLSGDAADLNSFLKAKTTGPVVLVGHSYGGAVITQSAAADPDVKALVYIDAFVPDQGESVLGLVTAAGVHIDPATAFDQASYTGAPAGDAQLYLKHDAFIATLANGLPKKEQEDLFSRQQPVTFSALNEVQTGTPAWKKLPSWYVAGAQDQSVPLALQQKMATRAHSQVTTVKASHLSMLTVPATITKVIEQAATTTR